MDENRIGMAAALEMAGQALELGELPVGAAVISDGVVVSRAHTRERSDSRFLVHAELNVLLEFDKAQPAIQQRRRAVLFTTVEPCLMCLGAAMSAFVGRVVYSLSAEADGAVDLISSWKRTEAGFVGYRPPNVTGGISVVEARQLFKAYIDRTPDSPMRRWAQSLANG